MRGITNRQVTQTGSSTQHMVHADTCGTINSTRRTQAVPECAGRHRGRTRVERSIRRCALQNRHTAFCMMYRTSTRAHEPEHMRWDSTAVQISTSEAKGKDNLHPKHLHLCSGLPLETIDEKRPQTRCKGYCTYTLHRQSGVLDAILQRARAITQRRLSAIARTTCEETNQRKPI